MGQTNIKEMAEIKAVIVALMGTTYPMWKVQCKMSLMKDGTMGDH